MVQKCIYFVLKFSKLILDDILQASITVCSKCCHEQKNQWFLMVDHGFLKM